MRNMIYSFFIFTIMILLSTMTYAQSVTVTCEDGSKVDVLTRWQQYGTVFDATVSGAPTPQTEGATMGSPVITWVLSKVSPSQPVFDIEPEGMTCAVVGNGNGVPESGAFIKGGGMYTVLIQATATWTDSTGRTYTASGSGTSMFFVRVPAVVNFSLQSNSFTDGPSIWGHVTTYLLVMDDNEQPAQPYTGGESREAFSDYTPNPTYAEDLAHQTAPDGSPAPAPGTPNTTPPLTNGTWYDSNSGNTSTWATPPYTSTQHTSQTSWYTVLQTFHCMETVNGFPNYSYDTTLNSCTLECHDWVTTRF